MKKCLCILFCLHLMTCFVSAETESDLTPSANEGILQLPEGISLQVTAPDGVKRSVKPKDGRATLPQGKYKVRYWVFQKKDAEGKTWKLNGYGGSFKSFEITKDFLNLEIKPEPIQSSLEVRCRKDYIFSQSLKGPGGERLYLYCDGKRADPPPVIITNQDKSFSVSMTGKYG